MFITATIFCQSCLPGGITFTTQQQIDNFSIDYPGCTEILGNVIINDIVNGNITNLTGLAQLEKTGSLSITNNTALSSLFGLDNITIISGNVSIQNNDALVNFSGLNSLEVIVGVNGVSFSISGNDGLIDFTGLEALNEIYYTSPFFPNQDFPGSLTISSNSNLVNLSGLNGLTSLASLEVTSNVMLSSLDGINGLTQTSIEIIGNPLLTSLNGLEQLESASTISLIGNNSLTNLSELSSVTECHGIRLSDNIALISLEGLSGISGDITELNINNNDALTNLYGLEGITWIGSLGGYFSIDGNDALISLSGLSSVTTVGHPSFPTGINMVISNNPLLNNISALSSIQNVYGSIQFSNNDALSSLNGLENIDPTSFGNLILTGSGLLSVCDLPNICDYLSAPCNPAIISANSSGCANRSEVESNCGITQSLYIITQPQSQSVNNCSPATFSVAAGGPPPFTYKWYKNGILISGATSSTYTTPPLTNSYNGTNYHCTVSNCGGNQVTSNSAILTVLGSCVQTYPSISLNSSTLVFPQNLIIQGSNFTPYGLVEISISYEDGNSINTDYPINYNFPGQFQFTLPILQSFKKGKYTIQVKDLSTGNYAPIKIFQVNNNEVIQHLEILSPSPNEIFYVGDLFNITWKDYITTGPPIGQSGLVLKEYKVEITNNNGTSWSQIQNHAESAEINNYKTFNINYNTYGPGNFKIRITDWDNPLNTATTQTFQVSGCITSDFKPSLEWDASIPTQSTYKNPIGLATDGTARVLVKLKRQTNKAVSSIQATIVPVGDNFNTPELLGKIMYATNHATYSEEANAANSTTATKTFTTDGNKPEYYFWLVAPDDFTTDINSEAEYRRVSINFIINFSDNTSEGLTLCKPIYLYRPPVVFVHGLFGNPSTFEETYYLNNYGGQSKFDPSPIWKVTKRLDLDGIASFQRNSDILLEKSLDEYQSTENSLITPIRQMHNLGFASKRVDYIAHSMGGAVGRNTINFNDSYYSPGIRYKNYSRGYINKFISICTPHNGSYLADFIIDRLNIPIEVVATFTDFWDLDGDLITNGVPTNAAYDLQAYNGGVVLPVTNVKNHLIGADVDINNQYSDPSLVFAVNHLPTNAAYTFLKPPFNTIHNYFQNHYENSEFLSETDMVVHVSSQLAGALPSSAVNIGINPSGIGSRSIIYGLNKQHVGIAKDLTIGTRLKKLLNAQMSSGLFANEISPNSTGQFTNDSYASRSVVTEDSVQFYYDTNNIVIIYPGTNNIYFVDSTMEISLKIKDTANLLRLQILFQNELFESYAKDSVQLFITDVHSKYLGTNTIYAIATYDSMGYTINYIDTVQIVVQSATNDIGFYITPDEVNLNPDEVLNPNYYLVFPNFVGHIRPYNDSIVYAIADTNVIIYDSIHFNFIAKDTGSTYIIYNYENYSDTMFVYITERLKNNVIDICSTSDLSLFAGSNDSLKTYQWQVKELNEFANIIDNMYYEGTDSSTLLISNPPSEWYNNEYRCIISDLIGSTISDVYMIRFLNTWNGSVDSLWENPLNWSCNVVPDCNTDVSIPSNLERYPFINSQAFCRTIKLDSASSTNIKPGFELWVGKTNATIVCPDDIVINLSPGECETAVNFSISEVGESCNVILIQNSGLPSGDIFPIGTTTNCFTYVDQNGNPVASCCFDVTVNEYPNPTSTLACNDNIQVSVGPNCDAFISADMLLEGGPYSCYNDYLVSVEGYGSGLGGITVTSSAVGLTLNTTVSDPTTGNSCSGTISVEDHIPPQIFCQNSEIPCHLSADPDSITTPLVIENCSILSLTYYDVNLEGICPGIPEVERHWFVIDNSGNNGECIQTIERIALIIDSIVCPPDLIFSCGELFLPETAGYPEYQGVPISSQSFCNFFTSFSDQDTIINNQYTAFRTWEIVDSCSGVMIECVQQLTSLDSIIPTIVCPADTSTSCLSDFIPELLGLPTIDDNCSTEVMYNDINTAGDCDTVYEFISRQWIVNDYSQNSASCNQTVTVTPASLDSISLPPAYNGACYEVTTPEYTGYPVHSGYAIHELGLCNLFAFYTDEDSVYNGTHIITRTWQVIDSCTLQDSIFEQVITLYDYSPPYLMCPESIAVDCSANLDTSYTGVPIIYDDCSEVNLSYTDIYLPGNCTSSYVVIHREWTAIDASQNSGQCSQFITIALSNGDGLCLNDTIIQAGEGDNSAQFYFELDTTCSCVDSVVQHEGLPSGSSFPIGITENCFHFYMEGQVIDSCCFQVAVNSFEDELICLSAGFHPFIQNEIDAFPSNYPECIYLLGDLVLDQSSNIENLDSLEQLKGIHGSLLCSGIYTLSTFRGLDSVYFIGEDLQIGWTGLDSLNGLNNLHSVDRYVQFQFNSYLQDLQGLNNLEVIGSALNIIENSALETLDGLENLDSIGIQLLIIQNNILSTCTESSICNYINNYPQNVTVYNNAEGCDSPEQISVECGTPMPCPYNKHFTSQAEIDQFPSYFDTCTVIYGNVTITGNDITNLDSLIQIKYIAGSLDINSNPVLNSLTGLSNLDSTNGFLQILLNESLNSVSGLSNLSRINGPLAISNNPVLTSLDGLNGLDPESIDGLYIINSPNLSECDVESICSYLGVEENTSLIFGNGDGCQDDDIILFNCECGDTIPNLQIVNDFECQQNFSFSLGNDSISIINNTEMDPENSSSKIGSYMDPIGEPWASICIEFGSPINLDTFNFFKFQLFSEQVIPIIVKLEGGSAPVYEVWTNSTEINSWETIVVDFSSQAGLEHERVCMFFNAGEDSNPGDTYLIDNLHWDQAPIVTTCLSGGISFTSQDQINMFPVNYPQCTEILGPVTINDAITGNIKNLDSLIQIQRIHGYLQISNNDSLISLNGLNNLLLVQGNLNVNSNEALVNLSGLDLVDTIGGYLQIYNNDALMAISSLNDLEWIGGFMSISENGGLENLSGFSNLNHVGDHISIYSNSSLEELNAFNVAMEVGAYINISNNPVLAALNAFNSDLVLSGSLQIYSNSMLSICDTPGICDYLLIPSNPATISGNATGCATRIEVEDECGN